ncbi:MAG: bifunctional UDP-N-acetylmuramoyl-tripeptide:D-alanyl-D-alanine ligase/alanine racemase [Prevotella sp.]|nr:bifunctional UDP-N-acetylmuramoyl-tripeptide:D-alanyl-D-alanine ligase/alanine racemase [Prevotella sp.]
MNYSIESIATLIGAHRYGSCQADISWLLTDSRSLRFPENTLFFALTTDHGDGHKYLSELRRRGVHNFVVERLPEQLLPQDNYLLVPSALEALQRLAERHRDSFSLPVVGITGSNGKTMVKEWLYQLLLPSQHITRSPRSYNSQIGVPLSVWLLNEESQVALIEAGISQPGEMARLADIIQPTIGVMTHLGEAHQENFRSMEEKCMEKLQLMHGTEAIVYSSDDDTVGRCIRRSGYRGRRMNWSRQDAGAAFYVERTESREATTIVTYRYERQQHQYELPFTDAASIENSITCAATALLLGLTPEQIAERMPKLEPVAMRLEVKQGQRGNIIINDAYNNDINSLSIALDFARRRRNHFTLILSDILQSGETPNQLCARVNALACESGVDCFIGIGDALAANADTITVPDKHFFHTTEELLTSGLLATMSDRLVLMKGARSFGFERISEQLEQKVHETILEVNLTAVVNNLNHYRSQLQPGTKLVCMIKADAYGAGAVEIAKTLQEHHVDYLAVAVADEGAVLRQAGITADIIVMNPELTAFKTMFRYRLEPEVYSFRLLDAMIHAARSEGITGWPVHIKLDTGMHRLGFAPADIDMLLDRLQQQQAVMPRSVFTHFVGSDSPLFDSFSRQQYELFLRGADRLQSAFRHKILRHICNSAGIEHFPDRQLEMCRLGIGLYGVSPFVPGSLPDKQPTDLALQTVSTLKTTILQLRHVQAGDTVGYSRKGVLTRDSVVAAIPIGYADGLNRRLGNGRGYCLVAGQPAPYIGNICMDVAMIDVTDIPCSEGDQVEIFGQALPVEQLAHWLDTIPYEILTDVSDRVKRIYYQD